MSDGLMTELSTDDAAEFQAYAASAKSGTLPPPAEESAPAAEPEAEAAPVVEAAAPVEADDDDDVPETGKQREVSFEALQRERSKRKEMAGKLAEREAEFIKANERLNMLAAMVEGRQNAPQPQPQPEAVKAEPQVDWHEKVRNLAKDDIFSAFEATIDRIKELETGQGQVSQAVTAQRQEHEMAQFVVGAVQQFASQTPDYYDALQHLTNMRANELIAMGWTDREAIRKQLEIDERSIIQGALNRRQNPAAVAYALAKAKLYKGPEPKAETPAPTAAAAPAQPRAADGTFQPKVAEQVTTAKRAAAANQSLSNAPGSAQPTAVTAETLGRMSDDDFAEYYAKNQKSVEKLMGRV